MIHESRHWKTPLLRSATWLERLRLPEDEVAAERNLVRVEKELFFGFYAIRKLFDTFKVSDSTKAMRFELQWSPCMASVDYFNASRIEELFDLKTSHQETRDIHFLCNQFIHSYIFVPLEGDEGQLVGCFVSSDRTRNERIYFVELAHVLSAFRTVGRDHPSSIRMQRNPITGQWEGSVQ